MPIAQLSPHFQSLPTLPTCELGSSGAYSLGGWACVCSRTPWAPPVDSPVRLGVSPTTAPPTAFYSQRFLRLYFPCTGTLGCVVCLSLQFFLLVYLHVIVGPPGLPASSSTSSPSLYASCSLATHPLLPACPSQPLLQVWTHVYSLTPWLLHFHTVWFSCNSGCFCF